MDDDDARRERFARRTKPARFAIDHEPAAVGLVDSAQDLYERRFPGAVLPDDRVHFAGHDVEINAIEDAVADERLADAHCMKQWPEAFADVLPSLQARLGRAALFLAGIGRWLEVAPAATDPLVGVRLNDSRAVRKNQLFSGKLIGLLARESSLPMSL